MWYVYMLLCDHKIFYIGITDDLKERFKQHEAKMSLYTIRFSEIKLVYCEQYKTKCYAAKREKQLKGWSRTKKQMLVNGILGLNVCTGFAEEVISAGGLE